jgi:magnesium-transporting ATPase (P-type)
MKGGHHQQLAGEMTDDLNRIDAKRRGLVQWVRPRETVFFIILYFSSFYSLHLLFFFPAPFGARAPDFFFLLIVLVSFFLLILDMFFIYLFLHQFRAIPARFLIINPSLLVCARLLHVDVSLRASRSRARR